MKFKFENSQNFVEIFLVSIEQKISWNNKKIIRKRIKNMSNAKKYCIIYLNLILQLFIGNVWLWLLLLLLTYFYFVLLLTLIFHFTFTFKANTSLVLCRVWFESSSLNSRSKTLLFTSLLVRDLHNCEVLLTKKKFENYQISEYS